MKGDYQLIASIPADEPSQYIDYVADPSIRSWRYRLSVVDMCGNESELSKPHKTMHLTMNLGLDNVVNLIWDHYEGFPVDRYQIQRYDAVSGWINIANMPSDLTSRTDPNPPMEDLTYFIKIEHPTGCRITDKKASTYNYSRSNQIHRLKSSVSGIDYPQEKAYLRIYPNPGSGIFNLSMDLNGTDNVYIKVYDLSGRMILNREHENIPHRLETRLDLSEFPDGVYTLLVRSRDALGHRILIKE